jgi:hypothetical protein
MASAIKVTSTKRQRGINGSLGKFLGIPEGGNIVRAIVEIVTVAVAVPFAESATELGETVQDDRVGAPPQDSEIVRANPEIDETVRLKVVECPATTATLDGLEVMLKSGTIPVPFRRTTCGLPGTLSVIVSAPRLGPEVVAV